MVVLFFNTIPKLKWYFLKRFLQFEIWNLINELFILCHIKIHIMVIAHWLLTSKIIKQRSKVSYLTLHVFHTWALLPLCDFITSCIYPLEITGSLSYAKLPNVDTFSVLQQKITFIHITANLRIKVFRQWDVVRFIVADTYFPKFKFLSSSVWLIPRGKGEQWCMNIRPTLSLQVSDQKCQPKYPISELSAPWP